MNFNLFPFLMAGCIVGGWYLVCRIVFRDTNQRHTNPLLNMDDEDIDLRTTSLMNDLNLIRDDGTLPDGYILDENGRPYYFVQHEGQPDTDP